MRKLMIAMSCLVLLGAVAGCTAQDDPTNGTPRPSVTGSSSQPSQSSDSEPRAVATAVARMRQSSQLVSTDFEAESADQTSSRTTTANIKISGPFDFLHSRGRFTLEIFGGSVDRSFKEILLPATLYFGGFGKDLPEGEWASLERSATLEAHLPFRTPGNDPSVLLSWLAAAIDVHTVAEESANGVLVTHYQGVIPLSAIDKVSDAKTRDFFTKALKSLGNKSHLIDAYIDDNGNIRRIYMGLMNGVAGSVLKSETNFEPISSAVTVAAPKAGVVDDQAFSISPYITG